MRRWIALALFFTIIVSVAAVVPSTALAAALENPTAGHWVGHILAHGDSLLLVIDITRLESGRWLSEVDVPAAGFENVAYRCGVFSNSVTLRADGIEFLGKMSADGRSITGRMFQGDEELDFVVRKSGGAELSRIALETPDENASAEDALPPHTIPITVKRRGPVVIPSVDVLIDGYGPYRFLLDFANDTTTLSTSLVDRFDLAPMHKRNADDEDARFRIGSLTLAGRTLSNVEAISYDFSQSFYAADPPDGIVGFTALADYVLTVDVPKKQLQLTDEKLPPVDDNEVVRFRMNDDLVPVIEARVEGHAIDAQLSLTSRAHLSLPKSFTEHLTLQTEPAMRGRINRGEGVFAILTARAQTRIELGGHEIGVATVRLSDAYDHAEIGYNALAGFVISFDQKGERVRLVRTGPRDAVHAQAAQVKNLADGRPELRAAFNQEPEKIRMILILAPT